MESVLAMVRDSVAKWETWLAVGGERPADPVEVVRAVEVVRGRDGAEGARAVGAAFLSRIRQRELETALPHVSWGLSHLGESLEVLLADWAFQETGLVGELPF